METLVDITTASFQAILTISVIFIAGYAYNGKQGGSFSGATVNLARKLLLPSLVFTTLASSTWLSWSRVLVMLWPILVVALIAHIPALAFGLLLRRFATTPEWIIESTTYNNVSSYPLLLVYALYHLSSSLGSGRGLAHLKWRSMNTVEDVLQRAVLYIVINLVVVEAARALLNPVLRRLAPQAKPTNSLTANDDHSSEGISAPIEVEDDETPTERTPLVRSSSTASQNPQSPYALASNYILHPVFLPAALGLLVGCIKPIQSYIFGLSVNDTAGTWVWNGLGSGLLLLGAAFAVVEMVGIGAGIRAGEKKVSADETVPPVLGTVLLITIWRFIITPAYILPLVRAFRHMPTTKYYLQDPTFTFILAITNITPPILPSSFTPFRSYIHFSLSLIPILTSPLIALSIAQAGRGISYDVDFDLMRALKSAGGGGIAGAAAMVVQVLTLMPMRTIMNYQYRYGGGFKNAIKTLWADGGFRRYYAGLAAALFQGPLARFGDTAANAGILALLDSLTWPVLIKTAVGSLASATFRMVLTPIDTLKTTQQTKGGKEGLKLLRERIREHGIGCLWYGALATAAATFVGNYPWFGTYNFLQDTLPPSHTLVQKLFRQAFIGFAASVVSDTISNSLRVVKTYRQVHEGDVGYMTAAKEIIAAEGILGLFGRGLPTRLLTNGLQGLLFSVLWKLFGDLIAGKGGK